MDATSTTAHITAKTATAAALTTSKSAATKPTPPKQNVPTAALLNTEADFPPPKAALHNHFLKIYIKFTRATKKINPFGLVSFY